MGTLCLTKYSFLQLLFIIFYELLSSCSACINKVKISITITHVNLQHFKYRMWLHYLMFLKLSVVLFIAVMEVKRASGLVVSGSCLCFLWTMWFCGLSWVMTSSSQWGGLQAAVMRISTSQSKSMVHREKEVDYPHWVGLGMTSGELPSILWDPEWGGVEMETDGLCSDLDTSW